jgi:molybdate transport system substrate-binding protein
MGSLQFILLFLLSVILSGCGRKASAPMPTVHLAAAASLEPVLTRLAPRVADELHCRLLIDAAASGTLSRQILQGSPADLFISANKHWMDELAKQNRIVPDTRIDLLSNTLVVIARTDLADPPQTFEKLTEPRLRPLAMGDPAYVPAGQYAKQALQHANIWPTVKDHATAAPNVQAALAYVAQGQCPVGIVYASDAVGVKNVRVLFEVPRKLYPTIVYPAAVIANSTHATEARAVLQWLGGSEAQAAFREAGFIVNASPASHPATTRANRSISAGGDAGRTDGAP